MLFGLLLTAHSVLHEENRKNERLGHLGQFMRACG